MRVVNRGERAVDFVGGPYAEHGVVPVGGIINVDVLDDNLKGKGFAPLRSEDIDVESVDTAALKDVLAGTKAELDAVKAGESAALGRVDALRLKLGDAEKKAAAAEKKAAEEGRRRQAAEQERDAAIDRLASAGGEAGRPWLEEGAEADRVAMVNAWRSEEDSEATPYAKAVYIDAWLHRQPDAAIAERWASWQAAKAEG